MKTNQTKTKQKETIIQKLQALKAELTIIDNYIIDYRTASNQQETIKNDLMNEYLEELDRMTALELKAIENHSRMDEIRAANKLKKENYKLNQLQSKINATNEQKEIYELFIQVLKRNFKNTIYNQFNSLFIEYMGLFENKRLGEKTYNKIREELENTTGLWLYIEKGTFNNNASRIEISAGRTFKSFNEFNYNESACIYYKTPFLIDNTVLTENLELYDYDRKVIAFDDIMKSISEWKKEKAELEKECEELEKKVKEYRNKVHDINKLKLDTKKYIYLTD